MTLLKGVLHFFSFLFPPKNSINYPENDAYLARCLQPPGKKNSAKTDAFVESSTCLEGDQHRISIHGEHLTRLVVIQM